MAALVLAGCATTASIENSWRDPEAAVDMSKLNKVLIVAMLKNEAHRRAAESQLAGLLNGKGVPSYDYFASQVIFKNENQLKKQMKDDGFDGAIVLRLADVEKDIRYVPGSYRTYPTYYNRFWPYFLNSWSDYSMPGHYATTKRFTVETNVYSLKTEKLVWSGLTTSVDPQSTEKMMKAIGKEVYNRMKKDGFIITN